MIDHHLGLGIAACGNRQVPGGFAQQNETVELAVVHEVEEEACVSAQVEGVLGIRNRYDEDGGNSLYIVMLLSPLSDEPHPDMKEVDRTEYFSLDEIQALEQVPPINLEVAERALAPDHNILIPQIVSQINRGTHKVEGLAERFASDEYAAVQEELGELITGQLQFRIDAVLPGERLKLPTDRRCSSWSGLIP